MRFFFVLLYDLEKRCFVLIHVDYLVGSTRLRRLARRLESGLITWRTTVLVGRRRHELRRVLGSLRWLTPIESLLLLTFHLTSCHLERRRSSGILHRIDWLDVLLIDFSRSHVRRRLLELISSSYHRLLLHFLWNHKLRWERLHILVLLLVPVKVHLLSRPCLRSSHEWSPLRCDTELLLSLTYGFLKRSSSFLRKLSLMITLIRIFVLIIIICFSFSIFLILNQKVILLRLLRSLREEVLLLLVLNIRTWGSSRNPKVNLVLRNHGRVDVLSSTIHIIKEYLLLVSLTLRCGWIERSVVPRTHPRVRAMAHGVGPHGGHRVLRDHHLSLRILHSHHRRWWLRLSIVKSRRRHLSQLLLTRWGRLLLRIGVKGFNIFSLQSNGMRILSLGGGDLSGWGRVLSRENVSWSVHRVQVLLLVLKNIHKLMTFLSQISLARRCLRDLI